MPAAPPLVTSDAQTRPAATLAINQPAAVPHAAEASITSEAATPDPDRVRQLLDALAATLKAEQDDPLEHVAGFWIRRSLRQKGDRLEAAYWARQSSRAVRRTQNRRPKKTRERQLLEDLAATVKRERFRVVRTSQPRGGTR